MIFTFCFLLHKMYQETKGDIHNENCCSSQSESASDDIKSYFRYQKKLKIDKF